MDVTAIQPVRLQEIVTIPDSTRRERLAVAANQTLDGQVISVEGDTVLVSIGQQRVPAQAQPGTTLRAGEAIRLFVRDVDPDQVVMQIVARGGSMQTMRSLTTEDLRAELTGLGVTPDDQAIDIARALINRGLPITAQNLLEVRAGLTRLGGGAGAADLDAAVFLKGQGLPITADGLQIVRQALQSRSALGTQVEGLRTALADLAFRLTAQGVEPAPRGPIVTLSPGDLPGGEGAAGPTVAPGRTVAATSRGATSEVGEASGEETAEATLADASDGAAATGRSARTQGNGAQAVTDELAPESDGRAPVADGGAARASQRAAAGPSPAADDRAPAPIAGTYPAGEGEVTAPMPPAGTAAGAPVPADSADGAAVVAALNLAAAGEDTGAAPGVPDDGAMPAGPDAPPPVSRSATAPVEPGVAGEDAAAPVLGPGDRIADAASPRAVGQPPGSDAVEQGGRPGAGARPEPSLPRLLAVDAETLDRLPMLDDQAVEQGPEALAGEIRRVIADHGTPVEAKLARVLEGLAGRGDLERLLATDLKSSLQALVQETQSQLALADRLPPDAVRELRSANQRAEALLGQVELQQLANAAPRPDGQQPSYLMFQLPIAGGREPQTAQIRIRQESDGAAARIDPRNVHVVFQLELQNLRTVRIGIRVVDKTLSCQMGSSDPVATELLAQHAPELREGLSGLGYIVEPIKTAVLTATDLARPGSEVTPVARPAMRVDARA